MCLPRSGLSTGNIKEETKLLIVKKFGGSSVADAERIKHVAKTITDSYKEGNKVVV